MGDQPPPTWHGLPPAAKVFRIAHAVWALISLVALGSIWRAAVTGQGGRLLIASLGWLGIEGAALVVGRGDCPFGPFQARLGDPVPLFELVLPRRAARAAVPVLAVATIVGMVAALARSRTREDDLDPMRR